MFSFAIPGDRRPNSLVIYFLLGTAWVLGGGITTPAQVEQARSSQQGGASISVDIQAAGWPLIKPDFLKTAEPSVTASLQFTF
ncbi:hypothetical protein [Bordetella sp. LUAb4]|uniref:hypothetical protein n=1 Tax=Bordetella sp. LUAb4 TaxID=2843195 RepID=UPI001E4E2A05|nr:hypothetical protein [Bordetella sp. LUAb4]